MMPSMKYVVALEELDLSHNQIISMNLIDKIKELKLLKKMDL
jgi:Leucine-rich repeat (LRR) protein